MVTTSTKRLDLESRRDFGELITEAWSLYVNHFAVFAGIALLVVAPVDLVFYGVIDGQLTEYQAFGDADAEIAGWGSMLVAGPLITAMHMRAVQALGDGHRPTLGRTIAEGAAIFVPVLAVVVLAWILTALAFVALIVPGLIVYVRWVVAPQAAVAEGARGVDALRRSWALTRGSWWRILGIILATGLISLIAATLIGIPLDVVENRTQSGIVQLAAQIPTDAIVFSFSALVATLLFFDLRVRRSDPDAARPPVDQAGRRSL